MYTIIHRVIRAFIGRNAELEQTITHAGFERDIISRRPTLYDEDGFEIDSEDDDEDAQAAAAEFYPYSEIRIESKRLQDVCRPAC